SKDYIVLDFPEKTKQELFVEAKKTVSSKFESSNSKFYTEVIDEQIVFEMFSRKSKLIMLNFGGSNLYYVLNQFELNFKDGRIMIKPVFKYLTNLEYNIENTAN